MAIKDLIISQRRADLLRAVFEPGKENADRFGFSLDMKELAALGYAVAHWSLLEEATLQATLGIAATEYKQYTRPDRNPDRMTKKYH